MNRIRRIQMVAAATAALSLIGIASAHDDDRDRRDDFNGFEGGLRFEATLSGAQEVDGQGNPSVETAASGRATVWFDRALSQVYVDVRVRDLSGEFRASHFHCQSAGTSGPVMLGLQNPGPLVFDGRRLRGVLNNANLAGVETCVAPVGRRINNIAALALAMRAGLVYVNVHTATFPAGELRGQMLEHQDSGRW